MWWADKVFSVWDDYQSPQPATGMLMDSYPQSTTENSSTGVIK